MTDLWFAFASTGITLVLMADIIRLQVIEVLRPRDENTVYRYILLFLWIIIFITLLITGLYIYSRIQEIDNETLRSIATVTGRVGPLALAIGIQIFYRKKR